MARRKAPTFAAMRSYLLLVGGLLGIAWEIVVESTDRPTIVIACLCMMGLTVPLHLDEMARTALAAVAAKKPDPPGTPPGEVK